MSRPVQRFTTLSSPRGGSVWTLSLACALLCPLASHLHAQAPAGAAPAVVPAGADSPTPASKLQPNKPPALSPKALREAEDAYVRGARALEHKDFSAAERDFAEATRLNPRDLEYSIALSVTREHRLTDLIQRAAQAEKNGGTTEAASLLGEARKLDPDNAVVRQHFEANGQLTPLSGPVFPPKTRARHAGS